MQIKRLSTEEEFYESERVIDTAFLMPWDAASERENAKARAEGTVAQPEDRWGLYNDAGKMTASFSTIRHQVFFGGEVVPMGEVHMVGSLPEGRGGGGVRALMGEVLRAFKERGDVFAALIPFSFSFYRRFGFELAARQLEHRVPVEQLASMPCDYVVTRVECEEDVATCRALYEAFAAARNLGDLRGDAAWEYKGNGEWGERDFLFPKNEVYAYMLRDADGTPHAYVRFIFVEDEQGPFIGKLKVTDMAYDGPEAFRGVLGFLHRMRAKVTHVIFELQDDIELATVLPECGDVECKLGGHVMLRLLDVPRALALMPHPEDRGCYVVRVDDAFMPDNGGTYRVAFGDGTTTVEAAGEQPDLAVSEETLVQLAAGRIGLDDALYRAGTAVNGNDVLLRRVFARRPVCLQL